jgi:hypothetical protein
MSETTNELNELRELNRSLKKELLDNKSENSSLRGENADLRNKIIILKINLNEYEKKNSELENRNECKSILINTNNNTIEKRSDSYLRVNQENEISKYKEDNKNFNNQF